MWHDCAKRQPEKTGAYRVVRRAMRGRPHYEDWCAWDAATGRWHNDRGVVIQTVEWWNDGGENEEDRPGQ